MNPDSRPTMAEIISSETIQNAELRVYKDSEKKDYLFGIDLVLMFHM